MTMTMIQMMMNKWRAINSSLYYLGGGTMKVIVLDGSRVVNEIECRTNQEFKETVIRCTWAYEEEGYEIVAEDNDGTRWSPI